MLKANSESELLKILKIISEESVRKTKRMLKESADPYQEAYMNSVRQSESDYGVSLSEQEEADPSQEREDDIEDTTEEDQSDEELGNTDDFGVSFDSVLKDINTLRSGRSTKDKEIKEELLEYYDRLDEDERVILHIFLRELSKILRGAIDGSEALDPSDAPLYADIVLGKEAEQSSEPKQKPKSKRSSGSSEEDVTPPSSTPIQVNEAQNLQEVRRKFRRLLKRI